MKTLKRITLLIICSLSFNISYAQSPVDKIGSGCALDFNGVSDYVSISASPSLLNLNKGAISMWVKIPNLSENTVRLFAAAESGVAFPNSDQFTIDYRGYNNSIQVSTTNAGVLILVGTTPALSLSDSNWHFVTVVSDQIADIEVYIDGILQPLSSCCGATTADQFLINATNTDNIKIGAIERDFVFREGKKTIDEVRIWNRALTQTEIQENMCKKLTGNEPGLVGYWRFDDCGGLTTADASGNGNNGTLH